MSDRFGNISINSVTPVPVKKQQKERPGKKVTKPSRPHKAQRKIPATVIAGVIIFLLASCYTLIGVWGFPHYITTSIPEKINKQTGLSLHFGRVDFNPFTFALDISETTIREEGKETAKTLTLSSFQADLAPMHLLRGELVATRLLLDALEVNLVRNEDGSYNLSSLLPSTDTSLSTDILDFSDLPFLFSLNNISLSNSRLVFKDIPKKNTHTIEKIQLTLPNLSNFSFQANEYIHPSFSAVINGSPIELTGQAVLPGEKANPSGLETHLACNFNAIDLSRYFEYLPFPLPFDITGGKADGTLKLAFMPDAEKNKLSVDFSLQTTDTEIQAKDKELSFSVPAATFEGSIQPVTGDTHFRNIIFREPVIQASADPLQKISALLPVSPAQDTVIAASQKTPNLTIDQFLADNGKLTVSKKSQTHPADKWEAIQISLKNYTSTPNTTTAPSKPTFRIRGEQSGSRATFSFQGQIDSHNLPAGELHLNNITAETLFNWLNLSKLHSKNGTTDMKGHLSFKKSSGESPVLTSDINEGSLTFQDLTLIENNAIWYTAPVTKITNFSKSGNTVSFGNVSSKNSLVTLKTGSMPLLFQHISSQDSRISLDALDFSGSIILQSKEPKRPELQFIDADLHVINLSAPTKTPTDRDNLTFQAKRADKGEIQAKGNIQLLPFSVNMDVGFSDLPSADIFPWFSQNALLSQTSSLLQGKGALTFPNLSFNGQIQLQDGRFTVQDKTTFSWELIDFYGFRYNSKPLQLSAATCDIKTPRIAWTYNTGNKDIGTTLAEYLRHQIPSGLQQQRNTKGKSAFTIKKVDVTAGSLLLTDKRLAPAWKSNITEIQGSLGEQSTLPEAPASSFVLTGKIDAIPFEIQGSANFFASTLSGNSEFVLRNFPLPSFHEQLSNQVDIDSSQGDVSVTVRDTWQDGNATSNSELIFSDVSPLSEVADSALPLALISDEDKTFKLEFLKQRSLNETPVPLFSEAITAFKKLILKAAVSPLLLTNDNFSDLVGKEYAEFLPGQIILSGSGRESLTRFSNLLSAHPELGLNITGGADATIDTEAMTKDLEKAEQLRVEQENTRRIDALKIATEEYLAQTAKDQQTTENSGEIIARDIPPEIYKQYAPLQPEPVIIDDAMLQNLANERARVIQNFLIEQLALQPERITIAKQATITENNNQQGNRVFFTVTTFLKLKDLPPTAPTNMAY
jgi:hypothetical protein